MFFEIILQSVLGDPIMIQVAWILCSKLLYDLPVKLELVSSLAQICYYFLIIYKMGVIFVLLILQHLVKIK